jgi:thioredoxin reductase (NADPH)
MEEQKIDIAIIGTGPAGISAAITSAARGKTFRLFGSRETSLKLLKAHQINNYPGLYGKSGEEIAAAFTDHLASMHIDITEERITNIYAMGNYFSLLSGQNQYDAKTVIIATGVDFGKLYAGEQKYLGHGVSYCATCDGMLYKGKDVAVIASGREEEKEAFFLASICNHVYYIPLYKDPVSFNEDKKKVIEVLHVAPLEITGELKAGHLVLPGMILDVACIFILRSSIAPAMLLEGLKMDGNHITVNRKFETNIPGCFAAGDITGTPYQYIKAAGEGNVAALSAAAYIDSCGLVVDSSK